MRWLVTGIDGDGRSCVVGEADVRSVDRSVGWAMIFETAQYPPMLPAGGRAPSLDASLAPGLARWVVVRMKPGQVTPMHRTETVDFDTVLAGSIELELGDGVHHLEVGDCAVMNGVDHAWRAGPQGCVLAAMMIGGDRASGAAAPD